MRILSDLSWAVLILAILGPSSALHAEDSDTDQTLREPISKALLLLEKASEGSADQRECFTCHSQALPVIALAEAKERGFSIDDANFKRQIDHTWTFLDGGKENYLKGKGQGGRADTAGYALWTLESGLHPPDEVTEAVVGFLTEYQKDTQHWRRSSKRPPSEASNFTTTYVAVRALRTFGDSDRVEPRIQAAKDWLANAKTKDTEDQVFQLRALHYLDYDRDRVTSLGNALAKQQRDDGGWSQTPDMESDAYATGTVLVALREAGILDTNDVAYEKGVTYLLKTQLEDGSWHVVSRSDPFQAYYESGFPHGADQFISTAATAWATLALLQTLKISE